MTTKLRLESIRERERGGKREKEGRKEGRQAVKDKS